MRALRRALRSQSARAAHRRNLRASLCAFPGLNLTFEVREGIVKHSHDFERAKIPELDEYLPGLRPPLEAQLIDLADEIAYNTADLDDGFSAGLFDMPGFCQWVPEFGRRLEEVESQFPGASERERFQEVLRGLVDWLVSGLIQGPSKRPKRPRRASVDEVRGVSAPSGFFHAAGSSHQSRAEAVPASPGLLFGADGGGAAPVRRADRANCSNSGSRTRRSCPQQLCGIACRARRCIAWSAIISPE